MLTSMLKIVSTGKYSNGIYFKKQTAYSSSFGGVVTMFAIISVLMYTGYVARDTSAWINWTIIEDFQVTNLTQFSNFTIINVLENIEIEIIAKFDSP